MTRRFIVGVSAVACLLGSFSAACGGAQGNFDSEGESDDVSQELNALPNLSDLPVIDRIVRADVPPTTKARVRYFVHKLPPQGTTLPTCGYIDPQHRSIDSWVDRAARARYLKTLQDYWSGSRLGGATSGSHFCVYEWIGPNEPVVEAISNKKIAVWSRALVLNPSHPEIYLGTTNTTCGIQSGVSTCKPATLTPPCSGICTIPAGGILCDSCGTVLDDHRMMVILPAGDHAEWIAQPPNTTGFTFERPFLQVDADTRVGEQTFIVPLTTPLPVGAVVNIQARL